jgi:iron complex outermembrane receptor protein
LGQQWIPYQGFPNQYMDMVDNLSYFANGGYERSFAWGQLTARTFVPTVDHEMNFLNDKGGTDGGEGGMPMKTDAVNTGYRVAALIPLNERDTVNIGNELYYNWLDDHWPAVPGSMMMGPDEYVSINDGMRTRLGTFAEWEAQWAPRWSTLVGVRNDTVWMNTGDVQAYDAAPGMMNPDAAAATAFNAPRPRPHRYQLRPDRARPFSPLTRIQSTSWDTPARPARRTSTSATPGAPDRWQAR